MLGALGGRLTRRPGRRAQIASVGENAFKLIAARWRKKDHAAFLLARGNPAAAWTKVSESRERDGRQWRMSRDAPYLAFCMRRLVGHEVRVNGPAIAVHVDAVVHSLRMGCWERQGGGGPRVATSH